MDKVFLSGRFTREHDIRYSQSTEPLMIVSNSLAVPRQKKGETDFVNIKAFGKTAENIKSYFSKGSLIFVECHVQTGSYEKDGRTVYTTDFIIDRFDFSGEKQDAPAYKEAPKQQNNECFYEIDESLDDEDLPF